MAPDHRERSTRRDSPTAHMPPSTSQAAQPKAPGPQGWRTYAERLARRLTAARVVTSPRLREAVADTPRHWFASGPPVGCADDPSWLAAYADDALAPGELGRCASGVQIRSLARTIRPPSVIARALEHFDLTGLGETGEGRVLMTDLGDGYAAALLCHLLGPSHGDRLVCVAGEPAETARAVRCLDGLGRRARVVADVDTALGAGPYAGILGEALTAVPADWIRALAPRGQIVARWSTPLDTVPIALERGAPDTVTGQTHSDPESGYWWPPAEPPDPHPAAPSTRARGSGRLRPVTHHDRPRPTEVDPDWLAAPSLRRLLALRDPTLRAPLSTQDARDDLHPPDGRDGDTGIVSAASHLLRDNAGSWAELTERSCRPAYPSDDEDEGGAGDGPTVLRTVLEGGPRRLWPVIEHTVHAWRYRGRPGPDRYGLTAHTDGTHTVWIDDPDHPLPDPRDTDTCTDTSADQTTGRPSGDGKSRPQEVTRP